MQRKSLFKGLRSVLGMTLAGVMIASSAFGTVGTPTVHAAGNLTDPIQLGVFWTSDNDTSDTVYFSVDGVNFHEICQAFTDGDPNDPDYNKVTMEHWSYRYADPGESGSATLNGTKTTPKVLKLDSAGNYIREEQDPFNDETLHDPSILYYKGYYWMVSGYKTGNGADRRVVIMLSYSEDLIHWSFPSSGSETNIKLSELPAVNNSRSVYYDANKWDMVAPDFIVGKDGKIYVTFSIGYFALHHPEDTRDNKPIYDEMYPYIAEITNIEMPMFADTSDPSYAYVPDPAKFPEASFEMKVTYSDATPIKLPCMATRPEGAHNHIDGSFFIENGYYYYSVKENGVTDEIYRITDLANAGNANAWESVSYDVITGYEGPCLDKYCGEYFMYVDRLPTFRPTDLNGNQGAAFGSEGIHVVKASIGTTGALDSYTGWLEANIKPIHAITLAGTERTTRHGTVITVEGEAASVVRQAAMAVGYPESALYGSVNASDWVSTGWYQKESYLDKSVFGDDNTMFYKYYYENNARIGSTNTTDLGTIRTFDGNPYFFKADSTNPDLDGKFFCGYTHDGYNRGEPKITLPVDWDYYNSVGRAAYGTANTAWATYSYDWEGKIWKCGNDNSNRLYRQGGTDDWYRFDPETGRMVKGAFGYTNEAGNMCFMWFDPETGKQVKGAPGANYDQYQATGSLEGFAQIEVNRRKYYIDEYGTVWYLWYNYPGDGNAYGPYLANVDKAGMLPEVEYHSPKDDVISEDGHPTEGYAWYKPDGDDGLWYWYEDGVRQGISSDPQGVYGRDDASGRAINRGREIAWNDKWYWLDSDRNGARAVGKEVWVPYIFQDEGTWDAAKMREVANESDEAMRDYVFECMVKGSGKWVRYDENGQMLKGWVTIEGALADIYTEQVGNRYYYDTKTGLMAKGWIRADGGTFHFDEVTGVLSLGWVEIDGKSYHFDETTGILLN